MLSLRTVGNTLIISIIFSSTLAWAQDDANDLYQAEKWAEATDAYAIVVAENPDDGLSWLRLAASARKSGRYDLALNALSRADDLAFSPLQVNVERARVKVLSDDDEGAISILQAIAAGGFTAVGFIANDPVLGTLAVFRDRRRSWRRARRGEGRPSPAVPPSRVHPARARCRSGCS